MEALAARIAAFCLQKHYIKPDQIAWLQYGLMRRLMGMVTFLLLLPVGAFFDGWGSTFLFLLSSASFVCGQVDTMLKRRQDAFWVPHLQ